MNRHILLKYTFKGLFKGLEEESKKGFINWQVHEDYSNLRIYNYSNSCTYEKAWNDFTLSARGLILDLKEEKIVALPLSKFFNYGELNYSLPNEPFEVFEKLDGSLGIIYWYDNKWTVATRGSFRSDQAKWAQSFLDTKINTAFLIPGNTYLCEIIYKENKIVIPYNYEGLVFLAGYDHTKIEFQLEEDLANQIGFRLPKTYKYDKIEDLLEVAKNLSANEEGFVVKFQGGLRIKIKGDEYCRIHRLISKCTPLAVWESFKNCDNLEEIKKQLPEEFQVDFNSIYNILKEKFLVYEAELEGLVNYYKDRTDKEIGLEKECPTGFLEDVRKFVFPCRKANFLENIKNQSLDRTRFFNLFRPTGNKLKGYTSSTYINRFYDNNN